MTQPAHGPRTANPSPRHSPHQTRLIRDARLALLCNVAKRLSGLDAAVAWIMDRNQGWVRWGTAGLDAGSEQLAALREHLETLLARGDAGKAVRITYPEPRPLPGLPALQCAIVVALAGSRTGVSGALAALGCHTRIMRTGTGALLQQLQDSLAQILDSEARGTTGPEDVRGLAQSNLEHLKMGLWSYDVKARRVVLGSAAHRILQPHVAAPARAQRFLSIFARSSAARLYASFRHCIRDGRPINLQLQLSASAVRPQWVHMVGEAITDNNGAIEAIRGVVQDVTARKHAEHEVADLANRLSAVIGSIDEALITLDRSGRCTYINGGSQKLLACNVNDLLHRPLWQHFGDIGATLIRERIELALKQEQLVVFEYFYEREQKWLEMRAYPNADGLVIYLQDVSERRSAQNELALLQAGIAQLNDAVIIAESQGTDNSWRIIFANEAFGRLTGFTPQQLIDHTLGQHAPNAAKNSPLDQLISTLARLSTDAARRQELHMTRADGSRFWLDFDVVPIYGVDTQSAYWVAVGRDVSERHTAHAKIQHLAFYDPLTDLPNREHFIDSLRSALTAGKRRRSHAALLFIDLDHFKVLNDTMGHDVGDQLLQHVAYRLLHSVRKTDVVARIGGDEFVVLLDNLGPDAMVARQKADAVANKLCRSLSDPFELLEFTHYGAASVGVTLFTGEQHTVAEILKQADLAMYQAKAKGRNMVVFFDPPMQAAFNARAVLHAELREGLKDEKQFILHYQPQFDRHRRMVGAEALLRWKHPHQGLVRPADFIAVAEDSDLIQALGSWVIRAACQQLASWQRSDNTRYLTLAVNVSVKQFRHPQFVEQLLATVRDSSIDPARLELELTESVLASPLDSTVAKMQILKNQGMSLVLDDFGTGYSSLSYLRQLPLDELKIDKSFVSDVAAGGSDAAIAHAIIDLAHNLHLPVTAEGVETQAQYDFLRTKGCDFFQGYLLAHPMTVDELRAFAVTNASAKKKSRAS